MTSEPASGGQGAACARAAAWLTVLALTAGAASAAARPLVVLNEAYGPPFTNPERTGFLDIIAAEAFGRIGADVRLIRVPPERGLMIANDGIEDGDLARIAGLERQYPNLLRVPEKLTDLEFAAFSRNPAIFPSWPVLRRHPVGYIKGWKIYERQLHGAPQTITASDPEQLFRLLDLDRVDVVLYERGLGLALVRHLGLKDVRILTPVLSRQEMFMYLHRRHEALVPRLTAALRAMKRDGFYQRAWRERLEPFLRAPAP